MSAKTVNIIGWIASFLAIAMFVSFIDQIMMNLSGNKGSAILPFVTTLNCTAWSLYGFFKEKRDYPILMCNVPGIIIGTITFITALP